MGLVDAGAVVWCRSQCRRRRFHECLVFCPRHGTGAGRQLLPGPRANHPRLPGRRGECLVNLARISLVVLATVVIFAAGVVTGGLLVRKTTRTQAGAVAQPFWGRFETVRRAVDEMDRRGRLMPDQR